jgi:hypothetical protein
MVCEMAIRRIASLAEARRVGAAGVKPPVMLIVNK